MDALNQLNQDRARQVVRDYLTAANRSASGLAQEAHLNRSILSKWLAGHTDLSAGSALNLYKVIAPGLDGQGRQAFVQECGLPPALLGLPGALVAVAQAPLSSPLELDGVGYYCMAMGYQAMRTHWEEGIPYFRAAESAFGPMSSSAAMASCIVGQIYTSLGVYAAAQQEFLRLEQVYGKIMDPKTQASVYESRGMLCYYLGDYPQAEAWLKRFLKLAEEYGLEALASNAQHFLGRVYTSWGLRLAQLHDPQANGLLHRAQAQFAAARGLHVRLGMDVGEAYDFLRQAQLARGQRRCADVGKLLKRARHGFGRDEVSLCHVELEEADLAQENGEVHASRIKAGRALEGYTGIGYARGMGEALRILGVSEQMEGHPDQAYLWFVAALCALPSTEHPSKRVLWADVAALRDQLTMEWGDQGYRRLMGRIREMIESCQGQVSCLSHVATDRSADIARVLDLLDEGTGTSHPIKP